MINTPLIYNIEAALVPSDRAERVNARELKPQASGSASLQTKMMEEADAVVQRALDACREEFRGENERAAKQKVDYQEAMTQKGILHRLQV